MARTTGGVGVVAWLSDEDLVAWVEASCAAQGIPAKVTDPAVVRQVCVLLGQAPTVPVRARQRRRAPAPGSEPPEGEHSLGVEDAGTGSAGGDHGVVEDGGDDGVLAVEVEP